MSDDLPFNASAPFDVELDITAKCQLDCSYCSAAPLFGSEIDTDKAIELIKEMGSAKVFSLLISGGEPTIHPGILAIARTASERIPILTINTNGIKLSQASFARSLHEAAPNALISISLDSLDTEIHNAQRGSGGLQAKQAIKNCTALGQPVNISCVVTTSNIKSIENMIGEFAGSVKRFSVFPRIPRSTSEVASTSERERFWSEFSEVTERLISKYPDGGEIGVMIPFLKTSRSARGRIFEHVKGCCCAYTRMYINSELQVFPCYYSSGPKNSMGSVRHTSALEVWNSEEASIIRTRARSECLCGVTFLSDKIPYRFDNDEYRDREASFLNVREGRISRVEFWRNRVERV